MCWGVLYVFPLFIWEVGKRCSLIHAEREKWIVCSASDPPVIQLVSVCSWVGWASEMTWLLTLGCVCSCLSSLVNAGLTHVTFQVESKKKSWVWYISIIYLGLLNWMFWSFFSQKTRFVAVTMCRGTVHWTTVNLVSSICCSPRTLKCTQFKRRLAQWPFFRWA